MQFRTEEYLSQVESWPATGRHILAQYDSETVVVYQAYRPSIGRFALSHGYFGGEWRPDRMTWIKPGFLWMMHRSGWAQKSDQEVILAIYLKRDAFDEILTQAVHSSFEPTVYEEEETWRRAVDKSDVRLQWDPDHDPSGAKLVRRAIQLGLRRSAAEQYRREWLVHIENVTPFVHEQRERIRSSRSHQLMVPRERLYPAPNTGVATRLGLSALPLQPLDN